MKILHKTACVLVVSILMASYPSPSPTNATAPVVLTERAPTLQVQTNTNLTVSLNWTSVPGAQYYIIKRGLNHENLFPLPAKITTTNYIDRSLDPLITHYYSVTPIINGQEGPASAVVTLPKVNLAFDKNKKVPILMYHEVIPDGQKISTPGLVVTVGELRQQLTHLKSEGYTPMFLRDIYRYLAEKRPLPKKTIGLTFDDGYRSFYQLVYPILQELNMKASVAIITGPVDKTQSYYYMSWSQIKEMSNSGLVEIASHTVSHARLSSISGPRLLKELHDSDKAIKENLGSESNMLVYPFGAYNQNVLQLARREYLLGATTKHGVNTLQTNPFELKRCQVKHGDTGAALDKHLQSHF